jgi:hypothetical protein
MITGLVFAGSLPDIAAALTTGALLDAVTPRIRGVAMHNRNLLGKPSAEGICLSLSAIGVEAWRKNTATR